MTSAGSPACRPRRVSVQARHELVLRVERPPSLAAVAASGSNGAMAKAISRFAAAALDEGLNIHVFGSWMWQALTGDAYVNAGSDLDVLIEVANEPEAGQAADFLQRQATVCPMKIDGELSIPGRGEVHWREYFGDTPAILLKSITAVNMIPREDLWK